ncbi:hypothetical protein Tco_0290591 [Tanacetum coccineum]
MNLPDTGRSHEFGRKLKEVVKEPIPSETHKIQNHNLIPDLTKHKDIMKSSNVSSPTPSQTTNNNSIKSILEKEKLNGSKFLDWYRNLMIVPRNEQKLHHLEEALPEAPPATATMLLSFQKILEDSHSFEMPTELKTMFQQQAEQELFETIKAFHACKQRGHLLVHLFAKMNQLDQMERLGYLHPLTIPELHAMLKLVEKGIPKKTLDVLAIRQVKSKNLNRKHEARESKEAKEKSKLAYDPKHKIPPPAKKEHPAKDTECHHCHKTWTLEEEAVHYIGRVNKNKAIASGTSDPSFGDYIELNDLNVPLELRIDQVDDLMSTIEEGEVVEEFRARNDVTMGLEYGRYAVLNDLNTAYWGFLEVGTTFDIFQNLSILDL